MIKCFDRYKKNNEFYFYIYLMYAIEVWDERGVETKGCGHGPEDADLP
jgi:hypothetical protein